MSDQDIKKQLEDLISDFNSAYEGWSQKYAAHANFLWKYDPITGVKILTISTIDKAIYRSEEGTDRMVSDTLKAVKEAAKSES